MTEPRSLVQRSAIIQSADRQVRSRGDEQPHRSVIRTSGQVGQDAILLGVSRARQIGPRLEHAPRTIVVAVREQDRQTVACGQRRVCAPAQQPRRQIIETAPRRVRECRLAARGARIHVRTRIEQHPRGLHAVPARGNVHGRFPELVPRVRIGVGLEQPTQLIGVVGKIEHIVDPCHRRPRLACWCEAGK